MIRIANIDEIERIVNDEKTRTLELQVGKAPMNLIRIEGRTVDSEVEYDELNELTMQQSIAFFCNRFNMQVTEDEITYGMLTTPYGEERVSILPEMYSPGGIMINYHKIVINQQKAKENFLKWTNCSQEQMEQILEGKLKDLFVEVVDEEIIEKAKELEIFFRIYNVRWFLAEKSITLRSYNYIKQ